MMRNLSGIYFRAEVDGKWQPVCFEDLTREQQLNILKEKNIKFITELAIGLALELKTIGEKFNIHKE